PRERREPEGGRVDGAAVGQRHAARAPFGEWTLAPAARETRVEVVRQPDLEAPGLAPSPAGAPQEVGRRRQRVRDRADDVAPAVPVEVDGGAHEGARHELRLAE